MIPDRDHAESPTDDPLLPTRGSGSFASADIVLMGASVRAAAGSAIRAGLRPAALDHFADADLCAMAPVVRLPERPSFEQLARCLDTAGPVPWMYTGAWENHPERIDRLAAVRTLWGIAGESLREVRDPVRVAQVLREAGCRALETRSDPMGLPRDGSWLLKPRRSGGGRGVVPWTSGVDRPAEPHFFQRRASGLPLGAVFVGSGTSAALVGATFQWTGRPDAPFAYVGSLGPWPLASEVRDRIEQVGRVLAGAFGLRGLFGVDLILADGEPWPVEVNPRYTASVEVLELGLGRALLQDHRRAFDPGAVVEAPQGSEASFVGKAILYAMQAVRMPERPLGTGNLQGDGRFGIPEVADLPHPGAEIEPGSPVLSVFAVAPDLEFCRRRLERALEHWKSRLLPASR